MSPQRSKTRLCGKCRPHGVHVLAKGHAKDCPYATCKCDRCLEVDRNRERTRNSVRRMKYRRWLMTRPQEYCPIVPIPTYPATRMLCIDASPATLPPTSGASSPEEGPGSACDSYSSDSNSTYGALRRSYQNVLHLSPTSAFRPLPSIARTSHTPAAT